MTKAVCRVLLTHPTPRFTSLNTQHTLKNNTHKGRWRLSLPSFPSSLLPTLRLSTCIYLAVAVVVLVLGDDRRFAHARVAVENLQLCACMHAEVSGNHKAKQNISKSETKGTKRSNLLICLRNTRPFSLSPSLHPSLPPYIPG